MWYISPVYSYTGEYTNDFIDSAEYGGCQGDFAMVMLDSEMIVYVSEDGCEFEC